MGRGIRLVCGGPGTRLIYEGPGIRLGYGESGIRLIYVNPGIRLVCVGPGIRLVCVEPGIRVVVRKVRGMGVFGFGCWRWPRTTLLVVRRSNCCHGGRRCPWWIAPTSQYC